MPAGMWCHVIHTLLEFLLNRLPAPLEYMLAFIYLAYPIMALFIEMVPGLSRKHGLNVLVAWVGIGWQLRATTSMTVAAAKIHDNSHLIQYDIPPQKQKKKNPRRARRLFISSAKTDKRRSIFR